VTWSEVEPVWSFLISVIIAIGLLKSVRLGRRTETKAPTADLTPDADLGVVFPPLHGCA
jgi:hypothetical protein